MIGNNFIPNATISYMKCIENNAYNVKRAVQALQNGYTIAHPADTCFGLAADLLNESAVRKLQAIKGRDANKPMSIMIPPFMKAELGEYALLNEFSEMVCEKLFPGPVTIVLPKGPNIPDFYFPHLSTVGVRIPYDNLTNDLLTKFRGPLITTSANPAGRPVCATCQEVLIAFKNEEYKPDLFLEGEIHGACLPSTVISLEGDKVTILREGPLEKEQLEAILGIDI